MLEIERSSAFIERSELLSSGSCNNAINTSAIEITQLLSISYSESKDYLKTYKRPYFVLTLCTNNFMLLRHFLLFYYCTMFHKHNFCIKETNLKLV